MNKKLLEYREIADEVFKRAGNHSCLTRSESVQKENIEILNVFLEETLEKKNNAIEKKDNELANGYASFELVINSMICELKMWIELKKKKYNEAWDLLIESQDYGIRAMQAHEINGHLQLYLNRLEIIEKLIFPPQLFMSDRSIVSECKCSICSSDIQECEHIIGRFYMGDQCYEIVGKLESINGIDFVQEPASKRCRITTAQRDGKDVDYMTFE
jgi:hypothetical protein